MFEGAFQCGSVVIVKCSCGSSRVFYCHNHESADKVFDSLAAQEHFSVFESEVVTHSTGIETVLVNDF